jgi:ubiquinone/menaquinone biosynthesis C-methylase UbiE
MAEHNEKTYTGSIERLRAPERIKKLEVSRVIKLATNKITADSVLDVGTGSAIFAQAFADAKMHVTGIDINEEMLAEARRIVPQGHFEFGSMEKMPCDNNSFDIVFMGHVLHETNDITLVLTEAKRVARKRVVILEWPFRAEESGPPLNHRLSEDAIVNAAKKAGFPEVDTVYLEYMVLYIMDKK